MGSSNAYLLGRFTDAAEAVGKARELLTRATRAPELDFCALVDSHTGLAGFLAFPLVGPPLRADFVLPATFVAEAERLFPDAHVHHGETTTWILGDLDAAMAAALSRIPPLTVNVDSGDRPYGQLEDALPGLVGEHWADLSWTCPWPEGNGYSGVGVTLNGSGLFEEIRRDGHELYWHIDRRTPDADAIAAKYAASVGLEVLGPPVHGW